MAIRCSRFLAFAAAALLVACGGHGLVPTPSEQQQIESTQSAGGTHLETRFQRFLGGVTLSQSQQTQVQQLMAQFRQAHPPGSAFDPQALRALHAQVFALLTPQQIEQIRQNFEKRRQMHYALMSSLTDAQRQQIRTLFTQFRQAHPRGSAPDPQAREQLHQQILNVLTSAQRAMLPTAQPKT